MWVRACVCVRERERLRDNLQIKKRGDFIVWQAKSGSSDRSRFFSQRNTKKKKKEERNQVRNKGNKRKYCFIMNKTKNMWTEKRYRECAVHRFNWRERRGFQQMGLKWRKSKWKYQISEKCFECTRACFVDEFRGSCFPIISKGLITKKKKIKK